ncbi:DUF4887 domain-containing protein [Staphylococcus haemolyticus]|uniref:DUF4887 domain-containing protein n=1 Tax=Staphylococcus haemolyticus TaxID=1283 RepID=UPI00061A15D0|nr:DUF4887 domain-containing protein [Staphylococcus haemolyticus]AKC76826.1 hypothetical protein ShL2_01970 [Staphylococcus haemolyticus]
MSKNNRNRDDFGEPEKKKMSGISKLISTIIVLLLLSGLAFAIFAFVDHSNRSSERLNNQSTEEHKDKNDKKRQRR